MGCGRADLPGALATAAVPETDPAGSGWAALKTSICDGFSIVMRARSSGWALNSQVIGKN